MKKNKDEKKLQNKEELEIETSINSGFEDFAYSNIDDDYNYYTEMESEFDDLSNDVQAEQNAIAVVEDTQDALYTTNNIVEIVENRPIKVHEIAVQSDVTKVNKFDLFFLRLWAGMVALLGYMANGINYIFNAIFKHKLPVKYIKAFLVILFIIILLLIIIVPATSNNTHSSTSSDGLVIFESNMVPVMVRVDDGSGEPVYKWGYLDKKKASSGTGSESLRIPAKYEEALPFNKYGIAWVRVRDEKGHYWELINKNGKRVGERTYPVSSTVPITERPFGNFTDSKLAWVNENGKYGYIDTKGNVKIACDLDEAGDFIDGIARVGRGNYSWFISKSGKVIGRSYEYNEVLDFSCGLGAVNKGGRWGFINKKGKEVIELKYDAVSRFVDGYAMVKMGKTFGLIDTDGQLVINTHWYYDVVIVNPIFEEFLQNHRM